MATHALAGQPAPVDVLIDVVELQDAYYRAPPDPRDARHAVAFGTSGHRGTSLDGTFTESHILAITQAICDYRAGEGITGPLFLGKDTHALSAPAAAHRPGGPGRQWGGGGDPAGRRRDADARHLPRDPRPQPGATGRAAPTASSSPRRTTRRPTAGSSTTRPTAARPRPPSPPRSRIGPTPSSAPPGARSGASPSRRRSAPGRRTRSTSSPPTWRTWPTRSTWTRSAPPA